MQKQPFSVTYGPFHRIKAPTQSFEIVAVQLSSKEIFGRAIRNGGQFPKVKAYIKPLCHGLTHATDCANQEGIEFNTLVEPDKSTPGGTVYWSYTEGKSGIREVDDETVALTVDIYKVFYSEALQERIDAG